MRIEEQEVCELMVRTLSGGDLRAALPMRDAIGAVEEGFKMMARGKAVVPQRVPLNIEEYSGVMFYMPAYIKGKDALVIKEVSVYPENSRRGLPTIQGTVLLNDPRSGRLLAIMDGAVLTAIRTGAATGVATRHLARVDVAAATIFGAGAQARTQLEALVEVRGIRKVKVYDVSLEAATRYSATMSRELGVDVTVARDSREAISDADVVVTATTSKTPVFKGEWLNEGTHINGIGSHHPDARELDTSTILRAKGKGKIVVDSREACLMEAGDIIIPIKEGVIAEGDIHAEIGEIVNGTKAGRTSNWEVTLFKSVGLAVQDAAAALAAYSTALKKGIGRDVDI
jgi:ornithine cyclodeaminase/alanine dehydrogenase